jgi:hypothetical protein
MLCRVVSVIFLALCSSLIARTRRRRPGEGQPVVVQASRRPGCEQGGRAPGAVGEIPSRCRPRLSPFRPLLRLCVVYVYGRGGVGCCRAQDWVELGCVEVGRR